MFNGVGPCPKMLKRAEERKEKIRAHRLEHFTEEQQKIIIELIKEHTRYSFD